MRSYTAMDMRLYADTVKHTAARDPATLGLSPP